MNECACTHDEGDHRTTTGSCGRLTAEGRCPCPVFRRADYRTIFSQHALVLAACQWCGSVVALPLKLTHDGVCPGRPKPAELESHDPDCGCD